MPWFDKLTIDCYQGDLLKTEAEVVACNVNIMFDLNYSLSRQLLDHCGPELFKRVDRVRTILPGKQLELGQAVWVDAPCPQSFKAIVFFGWWAAYNEFTSSLIYKCFVNALRTAFSYNCISIAFPLFGSGSGSMDFQLFAQSISLALKELDRLKNSELFSIEELFFISTDRQRITRLDHHLAHLGL